jgi:hypothetical protein
LQETKELRQAAIKSNQLKRAQGYSKCKGLLLAASLQQSKVGVVKLSKLGRQCLSNVACRQSYYLQQTNSLSVSSN